MRNILTDTKITHVAPDSGSAAVFVLAAGTTTVNSVPFDTAGFASVALLIVLGAMVAGATGSIKLQHSDASGSGFVDVPGETLALADTMANKMVGFEVTRPLKRYLRVVTTRATQNTTVEGIFAMGGGPRRLPVAQDAASAGQFAANPILLASPA